ncbi:MAG: hypothetical protein HY360_17910 [Verrucomicrobia bacterium]|nr:hypothetical protein [Verrucomicrobiota bacterium]
MIQVVAKYYQQFDADDSLDVPAEGYGGWKKASVELSLANTAVAVMHAWDCGAREQYPGWHRAVEYIPRATQIARVIFPPLLAAARKGGLKLFHVVGGSRSYYKNLPGYRRAIELAGTAVAVERIPADPTLEKLRQFHKDHVYLGAHNQADVACGYKNLDFLPQAKPVGDEGVAENTEQLFALCKHDGVNHLIYAGFAINMCLLISSGGMVDMKRRGVMCSAFRQAVTAVENKETARRELAKEIALWNVALAFGFVFDVNDFIESLRERTGE